MRFQAILKLSICITILLSLAVASLEPCISQGKVLDQAYRDLQKKTQGASDIISDVTIILGIILGKTRYVPPTKTPTPTPTPISPSDIPPEPEPPVVPEFIRKKLEEKFPKIEDANRKCKGALASFNDSDETYDKFLVDECNTDFDELMSVPEFRDFVSAIEGGLYTTELTEPSL